MYASEYFSYSLDTAEKGKTKKRVYWIFSKKVCDNALFVGPAVACFLIDDEFKKIILKQLYSVYYWQ